MKYMLLVYLDEDSLSEAEREHCYVESAGLARELSAQGKYLSAGPLHPVATATSVRVRDGKRLITDGPFAETRERRADGGGSALDPRNRVAGAAAELRDQLLPLLRIAPRRGLAVRHATS